MSLKIFNKQCRMIGATGRKLDALVHETACMGLAIAAETHDVRHMDTLINALNKGYRVEGFKVWLTTFSPIRWNGKGEIGEMKEGVKGYKPYQLEAAKANPFWTLDAAKEKTATELSPEALRAMIERFVKWVGEADANGEVHDKAGHVKARVKGNVVELKEFAERVQKAAA